MKRAIPVAIVGLVALVACATAASDAGVAPGASVSPDPNGAPPDARLAWMNPARCLPRCAAAPVARLVTIDDRGRPRARGRLRVEEGTHLALVSLLEAATSAGFRLRVASGYRSYHEQARLFAKTKEKGRAARPGHSEHQLGTAIDLRLPSTAAVDWLAAHAPRFGFVRSYPPGKQRVTGYRPEPWHVRFVGQPLALALAAKGDSLEEHLRANPQRAASGSCADCPRAASRAPCRKVTAAGRCQGTVLTWCYDGFLTSVDCATSQQTCGATPGGPLDCL